MSVTTDALSRSPSGDAAERATALAGYLALGIAFGIVLTKSEAVSWFRIQEMFRFQGFHMYGLLFSAVSVAAASLGVIERLGLRDVSSRPIRVPDKRLGTGRPYALGGLIFGLGWGLAGACPGPIFALIGAGVPSMAIVLLAALAGTWAYAHVCDRLPR